MSVTSCLITSALTGKPLHTFSAILTAESLKLHQSFLVLYLQQGFPVSNKAFSISSQMTRPKSDKDNLLEQIEFIWKELENILPNCSTIIVTSNRSGRKHSLYNDGDATSFTRFRFSVHNNQVCENVSERIRSRKQNSLAHRVKAYLGFTLLPVLELGKHYKMACHPYLYLLTGKI